MSLIASYSLKEARVCCVPLEFVGHEDEVRKNHETAEGEITVKAVEVTTHYITLRRAAQPFPIKPTQVKNGELTLASG